jgi:transposase
VGLRLSIASAAQKKKKKKKKKKTKKKNPQPKRARLDTHFQVTRQNPRKRAISRLGVRRLCFRCCQPV